MKALWGTVSLLVALAILGLVTVRQLRTVGHVPQLSTDGLPAAASGPYGGSVALQARTVERLVADDVAAALKRGADARADPP